MLTNIKKDIFKSDAQVIIHQANCQCTMGSGIAKTIKELFPEAYEADCKTPKGDRSKLGRASIALIRRKEFPKLNYIVNLYGQFDYGLDKRYTSYDALAEGFERVKNWAITQGDKAKLIGIPFKLGCNRAGGDWNIVLTIIQSVFLTEPKVTAIIYENPALTNEQMSNKVSK